MPNSSLLGRSVCVCRRPPRQQTPKGTLSSLEPTKPSLRCLLTSRSPLPMLPDMVGPIWLNWPFAGLMVISALYHAGRLVAARQCGRTQGYDDDLTHLVMSTAMAAMLVTSFGSHVAMAWSVVIGVPTLWFILRSAKALTSAGRSLLSGGARALIHPMQQVPMGAAMLFMLVVAGRSPSAAAPMAMDATVMPGMAMPGMTAGGDLSLRLGGSTPSVAATSLVLVGVLCLVAVRHAGQLRVAVATQRAWSIPGRPDLQQPAGAAFLRQRASGLVLAPGLSLGCQLAMSGTMIYMLVLMA